MQNEILFIRNGTNSVCINKEDGKIPSSSTFIIASREEKIKITIYPTRGANHPILRPYFHYFSLIEVQWLVQLLSETYEMISHEFLNTVRELKDLTLHRTIALGAGEEI